jgi:hypothetical protein
VNNIDNVIALIDTRTELPGRILGTLVSIHETVAGAFAGDETFQAASGNGHVRTKIVTLKAPVEPGQQIEPAHLA